MKQNRRSFIKITSIASASLLPVINALAQVLADEDEDLKEIARGALNEENAFYIIDNNLLNLKFHFINVKEKDGTLSEVKGKEGKAFMVVRLPQMHVQEKGVWKASWADPQRSLPGGSLSGYSFLAFQLWTRELDKSNRKIKFELNALLDWNQPCFKLITLVEWLNLKKSGINGFDFSDYVNKPNKFNQNKLWSLNQADIDHEYNSGYYNQNALEPKNKIYKKYKSFIRHFLDANFYPEASKPMRDFIPCSFINYADGLIITPISPVLDANNHRQQVDAVFLSNAYHNQAKKPLGKSKYEVWTNYLAFAVPGEEYTVGGKKSFQIVAPHFRAIGLVTPKPVDLKAVNCADFSSQDRDMLPSLLDKAELTFLTQYARQYGSVDHTGMPIQDFTSADFDIKELNGFFFTGLGMIAHLHYYNIDKCPDKIDLIEYEHQITQGRDVFIKVSRLGYNTKTGQRYKHVIEGKRKINSAFDSSLENFTYPRASFIELKQYCECIDFEMNYLDDEVTGTDWSTKFPDIPTAAIVGEVQKPLKDKNYIADYKRNVFRSLKTIERKRIPIICLRDTVDHQDVCTLERDTLWFWPVMEDRVVEGQVDETVGLSAYLPCEFNGVDWEGKTLTVSTPFMFIRKSALETGAEKLAYINYFKGDPNVPNNPLTERRKIYFNNQLVAFTPSIKQVVQLQLAELIRREKEIKAIPGLAAELTGLQAQLQVFIRALTDPPANTNKVNLLETDFIEYYFRAKNVFDRVSVAATNHVILPQVLRAKVYLDHVRDLTHQRLPSVMEYHEDYIKHGFKNYLRDVDGSIKGNSAKLIMKNTDAFKADLEDPLNRSYQQITTALRESKAFLGNLNVPDIIPDTLSLDQLGITIPPDITRAVQLGTAVLTQAQDALQRILMFNPRELLRGKLSDVCGLDLTALLDEFLPAEESNNHTPLFELNKIIGQVTDAVNNSPVYQEIKNKIDTVKNEIERLRKIYEDAAAEIKNVQAQLNAYLKLLSNAIPNADELDNLLKNLFDQYRLKAFEMVKKALPIEELMQDIHDLETRINAFFIEQKTILQEEYAGRMRSLDEFLVKLDKYLNALPKDLYDQQVVIFKALKDRYADTFTTYAERVNSLIKSVPPVPSGLIYYKKADGKFDYELTLKPAGAIPLQLVEVTLTLSGNQLSANIGLVQYETLRDYLIKLLLNNIDSTTDRQQAAQALQDWMNNHFSPTAKNAQGKLITVYDHLLSTVQDYQNKTLKDIKGQIEAWKQQAEKLLADPLVDVATRLAIQKVRELMIKLPEYVDFLKNFDPYYYYEQYRTLSKQVEDTQSRFQQQFYTLYDGIQQEVSAIVTTWDNEKAAVIASAAELKKARDAMDPTNATSVTAFYKQLDAYAASKDKWVNIKKAFDVKSKSHAIKLVKAYLKTLSGNTEVKKAFDAVYDLQNGLIKTLSEKTEAYKKVYESFMAYVKAEGSKAEQQLTDALSQFIIDHQAEIEKVNEARNLYNILTSLKRQELTYTWNTDKFRDVDLGIVAFKKGNNPDTRLQIDVRAATIFTDGKFPPAIERVELYTKNSFSNFGLTFLNILTISFNEITFIDGSNVPRKFDVKIKDVKFEGSLSFLQAFETWLQTMGKGLILDIKPDHLGLGYSLPIPAIKTPGFNFFNLSLNFDLRLYFDSRPLRFGFSLARPDAKFGIAVGIYAGFGFFAIVVDPKHGIVEVDCALEAGAWAGISIGPIHGEVKLAFGFRYTKTETTVRLEGYIVAEGRLKVWILEVSARIYLGIVSENSYVEGVCTVTYSVKLGFIRKSFSGSFHRKIAGAARQNNGEQQKFIKEFAVNFMPPLNKGTHALLIPIIANTLLEMDKELQDIEPVSYDNWKKFITVF